MFTGSVADIPRRFTEPNGEVRYYARKSGNSCTKKRSLQARRSFAGPTFPPRGQATIKHLPLASSSADDLINKGGDDGLAPDDGGTGAKLSGGNGGGYAQWGCEKCPFRTGRLSKLKRHSLLHNSNQRYTCEYCDYSVATAHFLVVHRRTHLAPNQNLLFTQSLTNLELLPRVRITGHLFFIVQLCFGSVKVSAENMAPPPPSRRKYDNVHTAIGIM